MQYLSNQTDQLPPELDFLARRPGRYNVAGTDVRGPAQLSDVCSDPTQVICR